MNVKSVLLLLVGILIGVAIPAVFAKGASRVTISGADLPSEIEITEDACLLNALAVGNLDDHSLIVRTPPDVDEDEGYLITRYDQLDGGEYEPFDQLHFYFDPQGRRGYVYYEAIADSESPMDGNWYRPTEQSQFVFEYILNRTRARLPLDE